MDIIGENDEIRMTNDERMTNAEVQMTNRFLHVPLSFELGHSFVIRNSDFVIPSSFVI
jgi:hypothetical protein